jgi:hypothetical protein
MKMAMNFGLALTTLLQDSSFRPERKIFHINLALVVFFSTAAWAAAQTKVVIVLPNSASPVETVAANELDTYLRTVYPSTAFEIGSPSATATDIYLGTSSDLPDPYAAQVKDDLAGSESYAVKVINSRAAVIAGSTPRATLFAVDALLEKLGFGFYLSYSTVPSPSSSPFSFAGWELRNAPIVGERVIFNWHNFLSSCSTWNLSDWQQWITQASRMRFNTVMVHAYGNNPMYSFSFNGETKPTGYLANTKNGRDWGTEHVLDVRKIVGGDSLFNGPVFGADASLVPDNEKVQAAEDLMQSVFKFAAGRGMGVIFALDVDTESANPQNVIATLPASARIATDGFQLVNPDTPEGYAYYRAEIEQLMRLYPEITQLAVWFRGGLNSPWRAIKPEEFPVAWRTEYSAALEANRENPRLRNDPEAPSMFAISKIARAFRKALDETGHSSVTISAGSWRFDYLPSADVFMPAYVALMPLDYAYEFPSDPVQERLRVIGRHRPVVPIIWAQHDDREFAGRSYTPFSGFGSMLRWSNSAGYGVIHWTTRPLDLFFKNISDQVWTSSFDETLDVTASDMAKLTFGANAQDLGKRYLLDWIYDGPAFGTQTSDRFLSQIIDKDNEAIGAKLRLTLLASMMPLAQNAVERSWIGYYEDWEHYAQDVFRAQSALQKSYAAQEAGNLAEARSAIAAADPQSAIEEYARAIRHGQTGRGEKGILISLSVRWLPSFQAQRVALGLDSLQVEFAPTHNEPLAQGAGHFTFDFDAAHHPIEVLGTSELGTEVEEFEAGSPCPSGIAVKAPVDLSIGNIASSTMLSAGAYRNLARNTMLPSGAYRIKLDMPPDAEVEIKLDNNSQTVNSSSEIEAHISDGKLQFTLSPPPGASLVRVCGLTLSR